MLGWGGGGGGVGLTFLFVEKLYFFYSKCQEIEIKTLFDIIVRNNPLPPCIIDNDNFF